MRDFETDFELDRDYFEMGVATQRTSGCRIDNHLTVTRDPDRSGDPEHAARLSAHQERIQREMQELGILHERNCT